MQNALHDVQMARVYNFDLCRLNACTNNTTSQKAVHDVHRSVRIASKDCTDVECILYHRM